MKRFGILLIVAMFGLVLACGSGEEEESPRQNGGPPPATVEKQVPPALPATPPPAAPAQPKPEHPKGSIRSNIRALGWGSRQRDFYALGAR